MDFIRYNNNNLIDNHFIMERQLQLRDSNANDVPSFQSKKLKTYPRIPLGNIPKQVISKSGRVIQFGNSDYYSLM